MIATFTIWLLIATSGDVPHIIDHFPTRAECVEHVTRAFACVEATVVREKDGNGRAS